MLYSVNLTFTVTAECEGEAKKKAYELSEDIVYMLGIENYVAEVFRS